MSLLKKFTITGEELAPQEIDDALIATEVNEQMIKDAIVTFRNNQRQWSASTKGRSEVSHSGKKPHPQKGTGNARQGSLASPQYKGGGRVFTPRPKFDQNVRLNKRERRAVVRQLLSQKILAGTLHLLEPTMLEKPQTKVLGGFLKSIGLEGKRVLFLGKSGLDMKEQMSAYQLSLRNLPKTDFSLAPNVNGYELALNGNVIVFSSAFDELINLLEGGKNG